MINVEHTLEREITNDRIRSWELWVMRLCAGLWSLTYWFGPRGDEANPELGLLWYQWMGYFMIVLAWCVPAFIGVRLGFHLMRWLKDNGYLSP